MNDKAMFSGGAAPIDFQARVGELEKYHGYIPTGLDYLDDRLLGLMKTDFLLLGAETGAGKTTLAQIMAKLAAEGGKRPTFFALEAYRGEVADRFLYREMARLAWDQSLNGRRGFTFRRWLAGECKAIDRAVREQAIANIQPWASNIRVFYRDQKFTAEDITRELLAEQSRTDFFLFDHVHYVDTDDMNENRGLKEITKALRNVTLVTERPVVAVAHLRKRPGFEKSARLIPTKDDFHGSSDLIKIATQVVVLAPSYDDVISEDGSVKHGKSATLVRLEKDRYDGASDRFAAVMTFDLATSTYDTGYTLFKLNKTGDELEGLAKSDLPDWAKRARNSGAVQPIKREAVKPKPKPADDRPFTNPDLTEYDSDGLGAAFRGDFNDRSVKLPF